MSEDSSFSGSFFTKRKRKQQVCYLKTSSTRFYNNAYKNFLTAMRTSNTSQLETEVSFAVSLSLRTPFRKIIPG